MVWFCLVSITIASLYKIHHFSGDLYRVLACSHLIRVFRWRSKVYNKIISKLVEIWCWYWAELIDFEMRISYLKIADWLCDRITPNFVMGLFWRWQLGARHDLLHPIALLCVDDCYTEFSSSLIIQSNLLKITLGPQEPTRSRTGGMRLLFKDQSLAGPSVHRRF